MRSGWFTVSPTEGWVLRGYEVNVQLPRQNGIRKGSIVYSGLGAGPAIPKKISEGSESPSRVWFEFDDLKFDDQPDSSFSLAYFGLPDVAAPRERNEFFTGYGFIALALLALAASMILRYYVSRRRRIDAMGLSGNNPPS